MSINEMLQRPGTMSGIAVEGWGTLGQGQGQEQGQEQGHGHRHGFCCTIRDIRCTISDAHDI